MIEQGIEWQLIGVLLVGTTLVIREIIKVLTNYVFLSCY